MRGNLKLLVLRVRLEMEIRVLKGGHFEPPPGDIEDLQAR